MQLLLSTVRIWRLLWRLIHNCTLDELREVLHFKIPHGHNFKNQFSHCYANVECSPFDIIISITVFHDVCYLMSLSRTRESERLKNLSFVLLCTTSDNHLFLSSYVSIWFSLGSSLFMSMSNLGFMFLCTTNDNQLFFFFLYVPIWFSIVHHYLHQFQIKLNLNYYKYHGHEKHMLSMLVGRKKEWNSY
jgi:hypothetical protein